MGSASAVLIYDGECAMCRASALWLMRLALSRGELGRYLVTFLDNHDQVGQDYKRRFAADSPDEQVIA